MQTGSAAKIPTQLLSVQTWRSRAISPIPALERLRELFQRKASAGTLSWLTASLQLVGLMVQLWNLFRGIAGSEVVFGALAVLSTQPSHVP